jgi:hypothetical protein
MDKAELSALILVNPDWHEPRARLAQLLLEEGKAVAALEHILVLAWGDWDVSDLQQNLLALIEDKPDHAQGCLTLLGQQRQSWLWPKELAVQIAILSDQVEPILANLPALLKANAQHPLAEAALEKYLDSDPLAAWGIARLMSGKLGQVVFAILQLPAQEQADLVPQILEKYPQEPMATVLAAGQLGGETGLNMLLSLEDEGFQPWNLGQYSEIKLRLLLQALPAPLEDRHLRNLPMAKAIALAQPVRSLTPPEQSFVLDLLLTMEEMGQEPPDANQYSYAKSALLQTVVPREAHLREVTEAYFRHLISRHIFAVMEDWTEKLHWAGYDEHSLTENIKLAASILARDPQWAHIDSVFNPPPPPEPLATLPAEARRDQGQINQVSLSPDGRHLVYFTANTIWWYDLQDQQYRLAQSVSDTEAITVHWAPDSRSLALELVFEGGNSILYHTLDSTGVPWQIEVDQARIMGWRDNSTILLRTGSSPSCTVSIMDVTSGHIRAIGTFIHQPVLTGTGKLAWANIEDKSLTINIQNSETYYTLPQTDLLIAGWLPGDRGLLLKSGEGTYYLADTATSEITVLDFPSFHPHAPSWRLDNKILGSFSLGLVNHILVLDIDSMELTHTGIVSYFGAFSGSGYYCHVYSGNVYIYKVP